MLQASVPTLHLLARVEHVAGEIDVADLFHHLSDGGRGPGSILLESGDFAPKYAERSIGVFRPSLCLRGKNGDFLIEALDQRGELLLPVIARRLPVEAVVKAGTDRRIEGCLKTDLPGASFQERLSSVNPMALLRALTFDCVTPQKGASLPIGLFGCFAYDFVRCFETIPESPMDVLGDPDYVFYLATRLFVTDHTTRRTTLVSLVPQLDGQSDRLIAEAQHDLDTMRSAIRAAPPGRSGSTRLGEFRSDTCKQEFCEKVDLLKRAITQGRVYQTVLGRMWEADFTGDPFEVYQNLKRCNPSPYLFYMKDEYGVLVGASPELAVRVWQGETGRQIELKPIAGTKPRGLVDGRLNRDLDQRFEVALKLDTKELAEHAMLIDLARNDVASVSKSGTTHVEEAFVIEKYSHVQHLVSKVRGVLEDDVDALGAYLATMNMGTLTGAPKPEAMKLIAKLEKSARGLFGGAVGFITSGGEMETAIVIRAMRFAHGKVYIRAGAGVVADSIAEREWEETAKKAQACIQALQETARGQ